MNIVGPGPKDVSHRLRRRVRRRYLRWLAAQPVESVCLSEGWRAFWRSCRRRVNAIFRSRLVIWPSVCLAACVFLVALSLVAFLIVCELRLPRSLFFAAPEGLSFADSTQRAAVALTRLTVFQSAFLPLLLLWASCCFRKLSHLETRSFYRKYDRLPLVGYCIGFICFLTCSTAVAVGASLGHGADHHAVLASLMVTGCLSWLAWTAGKRLMACPWPRRMSPAAPAVVVCIFLMVSYPAAVSLCFGSAVLDVSDHLTWLGPLGWVNGSLHGLSQGQTQNVWPLCLFCAAAVYMAYRLNITTKCWSFRRRLLSIYRSQGPCQHPALAKAGEQRVAFDLRQVLSGSDWLAWRTILYPRWMKGHATLLLLLGGAVLALQLVLAGLVLFLEAVESEAGSGQTLYEKLMLCSLLSRVGAWTVLLLELPAVCYRDQASLSNFAGRPVSLGEMWRRLQGDGLRFVPTQVLYAIPFVALATVFAPEHWVRSCIAVGAALLGCFAIRTTLCAGSCYFASIATLRDWISASLQVAGMLVAVGLMLGVVLTALAGGTKPDLTPAALVVNLLGQQVATFTALGISYATWHAVGRGDRTTSA